MSGEVVIANEVFEGVTINMISWVKMDTNGDNQLRVAYRGPLTGPQG